MVGSSQNQLKTLWEKEKLLTTSNSSFSHSVFKGLVLQTCTNQGLFGKGLNEIFECSKNTIICQRQGRKHGEKRFPAFPLSLTLSSTPRSLVGILIFSYELLQLIYQFFIWRRNASQSGFELHCINWVFHVFGQDTSET